MLLTIGRRCDQSGLVGCDDCCLDDHGLCRRLVTNKLRRHCPTVLFVRYTDNILHSFKQSVSRTFLNKSVTFYKTHFIKCDARFLHKNGLETHKPWNAFKG